MCRSGIISHHRAVFTHSQNAIQRLDFSCGLARVMATVCAQIVATVTTRSISELQRREDSLLEDSLAHLEDSLQDPCYAARRHAALTVPSLYTKLAGLYKHPSGNRAEEVCAPSVSSARPVGVTWPVV